MIATVSKTNLANHILEQSLDLICTIDQEGNIIYANNAYERILGYVPQYMIGKPSTDFIPSSDHERTYEAIKEVASGNSTTTFENRLIKKNGEEAIVSWSAVRSKEDDSIICIGRDITEQVLAKNKVREKEDLYHALIEHGSDLLALLDADGTFKYVSESHYKILGYEQSQLVGLDALSLIHPEDISRAHETLKKILLEGGHTPLSDFRYKNAAGEWRWLETIGSNQLHNPSIRSVVISSRDITESKLAKLKLIESEQRYKALFENNPDMVYFESKEGIVLDINPAALLFYDISKKDIIGQRITNYLSADAAAICDQKRQEALRGENVKFELEMEVVGFEELGLLNLDLSRIPVKIDGEVVGLYTIARDVTAIRNSQNTIKQQARKLNNIFESITDAFFTIDNDWTFTYLNSECERLLDIKKDESVGRNILDVFPEEVDGIFHKQYQYAISTGNSVNFEAFLDKSNRWLEVRAFPFYNGLSVYFADITARVRIEKELEKLSLVASKTSNGVVIMDAYGDTEWVNEGFSRITGFSPSDILGKKPREVLQGPDTDLTTTQRISDKMKDGLPFTGEILNYKKTGEVVWLSLNLTPVFDENDKLLRYILILIDITDTVKYRQKLKELSLVASTSTNGIFITDAERRIEWVNDGFTRLTGYTLDEVIGKRPSEMLHNERSLSDSYILAREKILRAEPVAFEVLYSTKSREDIWVSAEINPVQSEQGKLSRFIATLTDITALKNSELELTQLTKDLYRHNSDMQQFTYIVSHNLRSPVANALGLTQLLNRLDKNSEAFDKSLINLNKSVSHLDMMLKDLNTILSIKDVKETFSKEEVELNQVLRQVLASVQEPLEACGGKLILDIPAHYSLTGNKAYVHSIIYNLLSNAIKYRSPERYLELKISYSVSEAGETVLSFADNGSGFDMAKVGNKLFKLYNRFHTGVAEGRGIGLFLVKTQVEALGGRIDVQSEINKGTTFSIYLK